MKTWSLHEAKNRFSQVVELARETGPQVVTRYGKPFVIIVSTGEFKSFSRPRESVVEFFAPLRNSGIRLKRHRETR